MIQEKALAIATGYIGEQEVPKGSNWGAFVQHCLGLVGITVAAPWCQAFMYRCVAEAAAALNLPIPIVKSGSVLDCWNRTTGNRKVFKIEALSRPELVTPGMQFILKLGATTGHTGMVVRVDGHKYCTIEGNSNNDGSREGFAVVTHVRDMNDANLLGFIKYD
jgi:uncharacterized membrane protein YeaQ/YmgE (transglycosylase-associated protein family)